MSQPNDKQLSKGLSEMKFMKKSIESHQLKELENQKRQELLATQWSLLKKQNHSSVKKHTSSFLPFIKSKTTLGRHSFQSFNPQMEQLAKEKELESIKETDISNKEMASQMGINIKRKANEPIEYPIGKHSRFSLLNNNDSTSDNTVKSTVKSNSKNNMKSSKSSNLTPKSES